MIVTNEFPRFKGRGFVNWLEFESQLYFFIVDRISKKVKCSSSTGEHIFVNGICILECKLYTYLKRIHKWYYEKCQKE